MKTNLSQLLSSALMVVFSCQEGDPSRMLMTVDREYARPAIEVWTAALKSAEKSELKVSADAHDASGGELQAHPNGGNSIRIVVKSLEERRTRVSIHVDPADRSLALQIHEGIAAQLQTGEAIGGSSASGAYSASLESCADWARQVFIALKVVMNDEEIHASWLKIDGRLADSTPVRIRMGKTRDLQTLVQFISGTTNTDANKAFVEKMKAEFETLLRASKPDRLQRPD